MGEPLVSVSVITYNSSKYVIETLDSIKNQTYQNIELIVSDDCSTDNTVELCRNWIEENKDRFVRTELLTVEKNTGVSANCNRAKEACKGEWVKGIAGDDLLVPECVEICVNYIKEHPETIYLFGRQNAFGADEERCKQVNEVFDYTFFDLTIEEQLHKLIFDRNCIPATAAFYNKRRFEETGVKNDERIPLLEDWPKWINLLKVGVRFEFVDKVLVKYRIGGISTSGTMFNSKYYFANRAFCFYYQFPEWFASNEKEAIDRMLSEEMRIYQMAFNLDRQLTSVRKSKAYRLGKNIIRPFSWLRSIFILCYQPNKSAQK